MRRSVLVGIVALLMGVSLVFTSSTAGHNIDVAKAREVARDYARQMRDESGGKYTNYTTRCGAMYPNHNHLASCTIQYYNAKDKAAGVYTCKETILLYMRAHSETRGYQLFEIYGKHTSRPCGSRELTGQQMG
jgi:hypothetical protein